MLSAVKKHDCDITNEADKSKEELRFALTEAAKNSSVLTEYHQLYELQRMRLEKQIKDCGKILTKFIDIGTKIMIEIMKKISANYFFG